MEIAQVLQTPGGYERFIELMKPPAHPVLPVPSWDRCLKELRESGEESLMELFEARAGAIRREKEDPFLYGWEPEHWRDADRMLATKRDICVLGGNRAGKTEWAAKRCVQKAVQKDGSMIWCLSTSSDTSKRDQQKLVWKYLPPSWKVAKKSKVCRITYNPKDGFADGVLVGPNGSEVHFMNYKQDRDVIEGGQVDMWWADELIPVDWVVTLRGRTIDRKGKGIVSFTPVHGFNATVGEYITGGTVTDWFDCELLPNQVNWPGGPVGKVPYKLECLNPAYGVIFFQAAWNPYIDYADLKSLWEHRSSADILIRLHGVTRKTSGNVFPRFGKVNIVSHDKIPEQGTNYHMLDFAWNRNWSMIWVRVLEFKGRKRVFVYREWPDYDTYGEWVLPSEKPDGEKGPAQVTLGLGINDYKRVILEAEGHVLEGGKEPSKPEEIFLRYGDPRSGNAAALADEGATTLVMRLEEEKDGLPALYISPVVFKGGDKNLIREGVNLVNDWLQYDPDKEVDITNEPILYVSDACQNFINCMRIWTGAGGEKGAAKDFVDLVRYAAVMDIEYMDPARPISRWGGAY